MRTGVLLPIFQDSADLALRVAREADEAGVDGVFCYDHLWPLGQPARPALAPFGVLAAAAALTRRVSVGTLVARVGLVPDAVLLSEFAALAAVAPGRVVAGLGTGDHLSAGENLAYGVGFEAAVARRARLRACVRAARALGLPVWVGGGSPATRAVAADEGAALNLWDVPAAEVAAEAARAEVTWGGPGTPRAADVAARVGAAGATWAVFSWPVDLAALAAAGSG